MRTDMPHDGGIDANLLAAYAEGRLTGERRLRVEAALARDPEAREIVAALAEDEDAGRTLRARADAGRPLSTWGLAAAAAVLLGVGLALWAPWKPAAEGAAEVASRLAAERPDLFGGFRLLDERELAADASPALRGGVVVVRPRGTVLDPRPPIEWRPVAGAAEYRVTLVAADGKVVGTHSAAGASLAWPGEPIRPGTSLVVQVAAEGAFGHAEGSAPFTVATAADAAAWGQATGEVRRRAPAGVADLLIGHLAVRRGYLLEAERAARAHLEAKPRDPAGSALLGHVRRALGADGGG